MDSARMELLPLSVDDGGRMRELMRTHRDLPMDFADAALVTVAEREGKIFTLDRRDFEAYRPAKLGWFLLIP